MKVIKAAEKISRVIQTQKRKCKTIGFVPTMGALHEGHLSLMRKSISDNDLTVVSIFVNPLQFGPQEDFKRYPRPLNKDLALCRKEGVDFVFIPEAGSIYSDNFSTYVEVKGLSELLCGRSRPGHFKGVATVVAKLLNIVKPDKLYLGQKDAQQAIILKRMVEDLNFSAKVIVMPTLREKDGLAMSSRNAYLNKRQRLEALVLFKALNLAKVLIDNGARDPARIISRMKSLILQKPVKIDYIKMVSLEDLSELKRVCGDCLIALAVKVGRVRLIDNIIVKVR